MKAPTPYTDRITEKNTADFADLLKDAAAAMSFGSTKSWTIGTDGSHEWAIAAGWSDTKSLEMRLAKVTDEKHDYKTSFGDTGTSWDRQKIRIEKDTPKPVIIQSLKEFLAGFMDICGGTIDYLRQPAAEPEYEPAEPSYDEEGGQAEALTQGHWTG